MLFFLLICGMALISQPASGETVLVSNLAHGKPLDVTQIMFDGSNCNINSRSAISCGSFDLSAGTSFSISIKIFNPSGHAQSFETQTAVSVSKCPVAQATCLSQIEITDLPSTVVPIHSNNLYSVDAIVSSSAIPGLVFSISMDIVQLS